MAAPVAVSQPLSDASGFQAPVHRDGPLFVLAPLRWCVVVGGQQTLQRCGAVGPSQHASDEVGGHAEARGQRLGAGCDDAVHGGLVVVDEPLRHLCLAGLAPRLGVVAGLGERTTVLDHVVGRLHPHVAIRVEAWPARAARQLVEFAHAELADAVAVELGQGRHQHGANGDVDADAQRVGTADDREQTIGSEALDQAAIAGEHAGMVHTDAVANQPVECLAEAAAHLDAGHRGRDCFPLGASGDVGADQTLSTLDCCCLVGVHHVDRAEPVAHRLQHAVGDRHHPPLVIERCGPVDGGDFADRST